MPISNPLQNDERQPSLRPLLIGTSSGGEALGNARVKVDLADAIVTAGS
jgi:hypothetical protein